MKDLGERKEQLHSKASLEFAELWSSGEEQHQYSSVGSESEAAKAMAAAGGGDEAEDGGIEDFIKRRRREPP